MSNFYVSIQEYSGPYQLHHETLKFQFNSEILEMLAGSYPSNRRIISWQLWIEQFSLNGTEWNVTVQSSHQPNLAGGGWQRGGGVVTQGWGSSLTGAFLGSFVSEALTTTLNSPSCWIFSRPKTQLPYPSLLPLSWELKRGKFSRVLYPLPRDWIGNQAKFIVFT